MLQFLKTLELARSKGTVKVLTGEQGGRVYSADKLPTVRPGQCLLVERTIHMLHDEEVYESVTVYLAPLRYRERAPFGCWPQAAVRHPVTGKTVRGSLGERHFRIADFLTGQDNGHVSVLTVTTVTYR